MICCELKILHKCIHIRKNIRVYSLEYVLMYMTSVRKSLYEVSAVNIPFGELCYARYVTTNGKLIDYVLNFVDG